MSWITDLFGDQSKQFNQYADRMEGIGNTYNPYIERGQDAGQQYGDLSEWMTQNPNALQDQAAAGYEMSPYQKYLLDQTTQRSNMNAANSGMIQSPLAQKALNQDINLQTGQFMNDYIQRSLGTFGMGYEGLGNINNLGYNALGEKNQYMGAGAAGRFQGDVSGQNAFNKMIGTGLGAIGNFTMPGSGSLVQKYFGNQSGSNPFNQTPSIGGGKTYDQNGFFAGGQ